MPQRFQNLPEDIEKNGDEWKAWFDNDTPEIVSLPPPYKDNLGSFEKLCLLRFFAS